MNNDAELPKFNEITRPINGKNKQKDRFKNYHSIAEAALEGENPYEAMRSVLKRVGISTQSKTGYADKIGVQLNKRTVVEIGGGSSKSLLIQVEVNAGTPASETTNVTQGLVREGNHIAGTMTMDGIGANIDQQVVQEVARQAEASPGVLAGQLVVCAVTGGDLVFAYPLLDAAGYAYDYGGGLGKKINKDAAIKIAREPKFGTFESIDPTDRVAKFNFRYVPDKDGFKGDDYVVVDVSSDGRVLRIFYKISIDIGQPTYIFDADHDKVIDPARCPAESWKLSVSTHQIPRSATDLLVAVGLPNIVAISSAGLTGNTLAQASAQGIIFSTNAADQGWYLAPTYVFSPPQPSPEDPFPSR